MFTAEFPMDKMIVAGIGSSGYLQKSGFSNPSVERNYFSVGFLNFELVVRVYEGCRVDGF